MLVASWNPVVVFMYTESYARFAVEAYDEGEGAVRARARTARRAAVCRARAVRLTAAALQGSGGDLLKGGEMQHEGDDDDGDSSADSDDSDDDAAGGDDDGDDESGGMSPAERRKKHAKKKRLMAKVRRARRGHHCSAPAVVATVMWYRDTVLDSAVPNSAR